MVGALALRRSKWKDRPALLEESLRRNIRLPKEYKVHVKARRPLGIMAPRATIGVSHGGENVLDDSFFSQGEGSVSLKKKFLRPQWNMAAEALYLKPKYQRKGIGSSTFKSISHAAGDLGVKKITLQADDAGKEVWSRQPGVRLQKKESRRAPRAYRRWRKKNPGPDLPKDAAPSQYPKAFLRQWNPNSMGFIGYEVDPVKKAGISLPIDKKGSAEKRAFDPLVVALARRFHPKLAPRLQAMQEAKAGWLRKNLSHEPRWQPKALQGRHIFPKKFVHHATEMAANNPEMIPMLPLPGATEYAIGKGVLTKAIEPGGAREVVGRMVQVVGRGVAHQPPRIAVSGVHSPMLMPKFAGVGLFVSKEKKRALKRADQHFSSEEKNWDDFLSNSKRKSFVKAISNDPRSDPKLRQHVDSMNRLQNGRPLGQAPGGRPYTIVRLRGGGLGCTCPDWRYRQSTNPKGQQDCKHITAWKAQGQEKKAALRRHTFDTFADNNRRKKEKFAGKQRLEITPEERRLWRARLAQASKGFGRGDVCSIAKTRDGFAAYTHRARTSFYPSPDKIPPKKIRFVASTA